MKAKSFLLYSCVFIYVVSFVLVVQEVFGHGTMETPVSRIYNCFLENPENP